MGWIMILYIIYDIIYNYHDYIYTYILVDEFMLLVDTRFFYNSIKVIMLNSLKMFLIDLNRLLPFFSIHSREQQTLQGTKARPNHRLQQRIN